LMTLKYFNILEFLDKISISSTLILFMNCNNYVFSVI
jgi:hypothetical protein